MNCIFNRGLVTCVILACASAAGAAFSQAVDLKRRFPEERYAALTQILEDWNKKKIELHKEKYTDRFERDIEALGQGEPKGWIESRLALWNKLPGALTASVPLSADAQVVLLGFYGENANEFVKATGGKAPMQHDQLMMKLYLILSIAQEEAKKAKSEMIEPSHLFPAFSLAWTGLWPFCPRRPVNGR